MWLRTVEPADQRQDIFAPDLSTILDALDLRDAGLVGFPMGAGNVGRYPGTYDSERVPEFKQAFGTATIFHPGTTERRAA